MTPGILLVVILASPVLPMEEKERIDLRLEASDMFYHGYEAYMGLAWPADELMPLSCKGRFRGKEPSRGDIDDALGNFSLTLIDSLDMLAVLGDVKGFEDGVKKVIETVVFDTDVVVSVFETNIRVVGGLLSAHVLAEHIQTREPSVMSWYRGELLNMALDCANRLLPAFNSTTGLPYPRVNLKTGLKGVDSIQVTCTACAGSMILEFAALSRLTGEKVFEERASRAMDVLWAARHRHSNLVGNVLNVNTGDWVRKDSGVGAGIDSYYEYVAKAYVLLGEEKYLERWNTHYSAVMKYMTSGPLMMDVHMHRPTTNSKHFADSLGAFWPGLQVLMGDLKPAIEQHEVLYQIMQRHNFLPEAVTADFQVHWGQHLLRPEFVESTYFLYKATQDPYYLEVGKKVLKSLQLHARVTCGYAAVKDVRTLQHEDRMDSFVLTETFKYLYLLFTKDEELYLDMSQFVFTTEAHLLPLTLARLSNSTALPISDKFQYDEDEEVEFEQACPSTRYMFPGHDTAHTGAASLRKPLERMVEETCPSVRMMERKLTAAQFQSTNEEHLKLVRNMGITIVTLPDGRVQLLHTHANARSPEDGEEGLLFMQEMIDLSKQQASQPESPPKMVTFKVGGRQHQFQAGPAQFGTDLTGGVKVTERVVLAQHLRACSGSLQNGESMTGKIVIAERGDCMFVEKARVLQSLGAIGGIVLDSTEGTAAATSPLFAMSGDGVDDIKIPMVFLFMEEAIKLLEVFKSHPDLEVTLEEKPASTESDFVSSTDDASEDLDDESTDKLKSAVHAFLEKNIKKDNVEMDPGSSDKILIHMDNDTGEIISQKIHTIRSPGGSTRTIKTVEKLKNGVGSVKVLKIEEMMKIKEEEKMIEDELENITDTAESVSGQDDSMYSFPEEEEIEEVNVWNSEEEENEMNVYGDVTEEKEESAKLTDILDLLKPHSEELQTLIKEKSIGDPSFFSSLLSTDLATLLRVFQHVFLKSSSIEEAYRSLIKGVESEGVESFAARILGEEEQIPKVNKDHYLTVSKLVSQLNSQGGAISSLLGRERMDQLVKEYLKVMQDSEPDQHKLLHTIKVLIQRLSEQLEEAKKGSDSSP